MKTFNELLAAAKVVLSNKRGEADWLILSTHCEKLEDAIAAAEREAKERIQSIDDEWLRSVGFVDFEAGQGHWLTGLKLVVSDGFVIVRNSEGVWFMRGAELPIQPKNKGQLLDLLKGLGHA